MSQVGGGRASACRGQWMVNCLCSTWRQASGGLPCRRWLSSYWPRRVLIVGEQVSEGWPLDVGGRGGRVKRTLTRVAGERVAEGERAGGRPRVEVISGGERACGVRTWTTRHSPPHCLLHHEVRFRYVFVPRILFVAEKLTELCCASTTRSRCPGTRRGRGVRGGKGMSRAR